MTEEERTTTIEAKREAFNKLALELRNVPFPEEDTLNEEVKKILDPAKCAVIVIDMHGAYCDPTEVLPTLMGSTTDQLQTVVPKLEDFLNHARAAGVTVVWTKMKENPDDMPDNYKTKWKIDDTPPLSVPGTKGYEYVGLSPQEGDQEVEKVTYNIFKGTGLDEKLRAAGIETIIFTGGYTSRCVLSSGTTAADFLGYNIFMSRDLVGVPDTIIAEELTAFSLVHDIYGFMKTPRVITEAWNSYSKTA